MSWSIGMIPVTEHGRVVASSALRVLEALGHRLDVTEFDLGAGRYLTTGEVLPDDDLAALRSVDALVVGSPPVGVPGVPSGLLERGIIFRLRGELDLYVNLRRYTGPGQVDIAVVRENTEGGYIGEGGVMRAGTPHAVATQGSVTTAFGVERCLNFAFGLARKRQARLTLVHKANVLTYSGSLWTSAFVRLAMQQPDIECSYVDVDTACVQLVEDASRFDVIVTDNLFGDIVTDVAGAVTHSLHRSGSTDLNPTGPGPSLFEPLHASAARVARTPLELADPRGAHAAMAMLLDHFGQPEAAEQLYRAVRSVPDDETRSLVETEAAVLESYGSAGNHAS